MPGNNHPADLSAYLRRSGVSDDAIYKYPEAAAELSRISFLQENWLKARHELRSYILFVIAAPVTAPIFYILRPSVLMLGCSISFAVIVIVTCARQISRRKQAMRDYLGGMDRLVQIVRKQEARSSDETT